jgi:hypothetical protein
MNEWQKEKRQGVIMEKTKNIITAVAIVDLENGKTMVEVEINKEKFMLCCFFATDIRKAAEARELIKGLAAQLHGLGIAKTKKDFREN